MMDTKNMLDANEMKTAKVHTDEQILLRKVRKQLGLSQSQFASKIKTPTRTVQEWEQGRAVPPSMLNVLLKAIEKYPDILENT